MSSAVTFAKWILRKQGCLALGSLLAMACIGLAGCEHLKSPDAGAHGGKAATPVAKTSNAPPAKPVDVKYVTPIQKVITEYEEFTGRTAPVESVVIRARVSGYLNEIGFKDGARIEKDQILFTIDDRSFKSEALRARALVDQAQARYDRLDKQDKRASQLIQTGSITQEEFEIILGDKSEAAAALDAARAALEIADLNLSFTQVRSPISGRVGHRMIDAGNLVQADTTILATIVTDDEVFAYFDLNERIELRLRRLLQQSSASSALAEGKLEIQVALADEANFALRGLVDFTDNQVDPSTGTLRYRARIDNKSGFLLPGLFVRIRYPIGEPKPALLVPEEALLFDQGQRKVFVVDESNKIATRLVTLGVQDEKNRVILSGLNPEDRVVVTGLQRIRSGTDVNAISLEDGASPGGTPTPGSGTASGTKPAESTVNRTTKGPAT